MNSRLLIVDGHAYAYRAFYAIRGMRSPAGQPTGAIFGFVKMLARMRAAARPTHWMVAWDGGLSAVRQAALPEYKAQRPEMPADLAAQLDEIVSYLAAANITSYCREGVEADDYIAGLARRAAAAEFEVVIASADKDFMQLVTFVSGSEGPGAGENPAATSASTGGRGWIGLLNPADKSERVWGAEQVRGKTGVAPEQIVDWLSLAGDGVDNIPGVPGVGAKTAAGLLRQFGSVDELFRRLDEVKSERIREALRGAEGTVRRNQELVRLRTDVECELAPDTLRLRDGDAGRLAELYRRWGFRSLLAEVALGSGEETTSQAREPGPETGQRILL